MAKPFLGDWVQVLTVYAQNVHHSFLSRECSQPEAISPKRLFLLREINESWLLDPVVYRKSCLFIYLYAVTPFFCSTLYNKHFELPGCCGFSSWEARLFKDSFLFVCMCLSSFTPSIALSQVQLWNHDGCGKGDVLYIISYFGVLVTVFCKSLCIHILRIYFTTYDLKSPATALS